MVIKRTRAVAVIIHAVSPLSRVSAWATAGNSNKTVDNAPALILPNIEECFEIIIFTSGRFCLSPVRHACGVPHFRLRFSNYDITEARR
jgi:hypothetical protein